MSLGFPRIILERVIGVWLDKYLGKYILEIYPEVDYWENLPTALRYNIFVKMLPRERAWVLVEKMGKIDEAKKFWTERFCGNERHHKCPHCNSFLEVIMWEADVYSCNNRKCPYVSQEGPHPWTGCNHTEASDDSCGDFRWDQWDY